MTPSLEALAAYVPHRVLSQLAAGAALPAPGDEDSAPVERVAAAVLFCDLSGFSAHASRLARRGPDGVEALGALIEAFFGRLIELVWSFGGDVLKFAGDALVAVWTVGAADPTLNTATSRAAGCAIAVRRVLHEREVQPGVELAVRVGVGAGDLALRLVGGVRGRVELFVTGEAVARAAKAQQHAPRGGAAIDPVARSLLQDRGAGGSLTDGFQQLDRVPQTLTLRPLASPALPPAIGPRLRCFVPSIVRSRLDAGQPDWVAEIRRINVLFLSLAELAERPELAHRAVCAAQDAIYRYDGSLHHVSVDDKGPMLVAAFGLPPLAHEDDAARAVLAALDVHAALRGLGLAARVGVATGRVFCGAVGTSRRREYSLIGETVVRAARLMQAAQDGVVCDLATHRGARDRVAFDQGLPLAVKGRSEPISVYRVRARRRLPVASQEGRGAPGRRAEREALSALVTRAREGVGGVVIIEGEALLGKSHLAAEVLERATGLTRLRGAGQELDQNTPWHAWRPVFAALLGGESGLHDTNVWRSAAMSQLTADPALLESAPLLNDVLPLDLPESPLTASLSGDARLERTRELLLRLLERVAASGPVVLVLEDVQWLDSASQSLLWAVHRRVRPLLLVLTRRPPEPGEPDPADELLRQSGTLALRLGAVSRDETRDIVAHALGVETVAPEVVSLIHARGGGSPFVSEELAASLRDAGVLRLTGGVAEVAPGAPPLEALELPDTVQGIVTSRIDRLEPGPTLALKVASAIGPIAPLALIEAAYPVQADRETVRQHVAALVRARLMEPVEAAEPTYAFRDDITREVASRLMVSAQRRDLHRAIAEWHESRRAGESRQLHALLARHWTEAGEAARAIEHLERAGRLASQAGAWPEAAWCFSEALRLDGPADPSLGEATLRRASWLRQRGEARVELGQREQGVADLVAAAEQVGFAYPGTTAARLLALVVPSLAVLFPSRELPAPQDALTAVRRQEAARAYLSLSEAYYLGQRTLDVALCMVRAVWLAAAGGPSALLARTQANLALGCAAVPLPRLSDALLRRARATAALSGNRAARTWAAMVAGQIALGEGRWDEALTELQAAREGLAAQGDARVQSLCLLAIGFVHTYRGDLGGALRASDALDEVTALSSDPSGLAAALRVRALIAGRLGQTTQSLGLLERARAALPVGASATARMGVAGQLAAALWEAGRHEDSRQAAATARGLLGQGRPTAINGFAGYAGVAYVALMDLSAARAAGQDGAIALETARRDVRRLARFGRIYPLGRPLATVRRAQLERISGRPDRGLRLAAQAVSLAVAQGMPYEEALAHAELAAHGPAAARPAHQERADALLAALRAGARREG